MGGKRVKNKTKQNRKWPEEVISQKRKPTSHCLLKIRVRRWRATLMMVENKDRNQQGQQGQVRQ